MIHKPDTCGCELEYTFDPENTDESTHQIVRVVACSAHQGLTDEEVFLQVKAEQRAIGETKLALASNFPELSYERLDPITGKSMKDDNGDVIMDLDHRLIDVKFDKKRKLLISVPSLKQANQVKQLIVQPGDKHDEVASVVGSLNSLDLTNIKAKHG